MKNGGMAAMLYDLQQADISGVDLRKIPRTEALLEQIIESMTSAQSFWFDCLKKNTDINSAVPNTNNNRAEPAFPG